MKRNLLILALFITAFCFTGSALAQDGGVPDTLYLEAWGDDLGVFLPGPFLIKTPMYVSHDNPDPIDSIAGFVIPLCYTATVVSGTMNYCSLGGYWHSTTLNPYDPNIDRSVFRDMPDNASPTIANRMFALDRDFSQRGWDFRFVDLGDEVSQFWMSLVPTGSPDQRWWEGSKVLLATMTFKADFDDEIQICIDSCFWPPSSRLAFSNSAAATYIPMIWDDYLGEEEYCFNPYVIPDPPPEFTDGVDDQTCPTNDHYSTDQFTAVDVDPFANIVSVTVSPTSATGIANVTVVQDAKDVTFVGHVEFDITDHCTASGTFTLTVTDGAGSQDTDEFTITGTNEAPVLTCPAGGTVTYCDGFTGTATATDANDDDVVFSGDAAADGSIDLSFTCQDLGPQTFTVIGTDECGATGQCTFDLNIVNAPPSITCPENAIVTAGAPFVSTDFVAGDDCPGYTVGVGISPAPVGAVPTVVGSHVEWNTDTNDEGTFTLTLTVTDECGETADCDFVVEVVSYGFSNILIPNSECANPGEYVCLPILLDNNTTPFGGFELAIEFDYTAMTFVSAEPCEAIEGFEYFTYRLLPCPLCGCCKYKILLYGQYDMPNGSENIGDPIPMTPMGEYQCLVELCFVVNNNENLRGFKIPVCFEWEGTMGDSCLIEDWNCGENTFSSLTGDTLYTSFLCCQFVADLCDDPSDRVDGKLIFQHGVCGQNCGGVDVCAAGPGECKRGDVNYNTITYEVADAVLFASYFVEGTGVFRYDLAYQICATDVNADGRTLTLSDLVYLIRVILHDAVEIPKLAPSSDVAGLIVADGTISAECASPIGALLFEFDGAVEPTLLATDMEMLNNDNKVLVWSRQGNSIENAEVISFAGAELVSVAAVDRDSRVLETTISARITPSAFALHAAYPNPFNPFTNLSFSLPEAASYSLNIYNVAGQLVRSYEGVGAAGLNVITWDGKDNAGSEVSSGVYFQKLMAAGNSATAKMVMMK